MKIALGCDHGGYELKQHIIKVLEKLGHECEDIGCYNLASCDYPDFGAAAAKAVAEGKCDKGIVVCTTGIGISIAANKVITGLWLERLVDNINFDDYESRNYFDQQLRKCGLFARLEEMGIQDGDTVDIYDIEFEYQR